MMPSTGLISRAEPCFFLFDDREIELFEQRFRLGQGTAGGRRLKSPARVAEWCLVAKIPVEGLAAEWQIRRERDVKTANGADGCVQHCSATFAVFADELPGRVLFDIIVRFTLFLLRRLAAANSQVLVGRDVVGEVVFLAYGGAVAHQLSWPAEGVKPDVVFADEVVALRPGVLPEVPPALWLGVLLGPCDCR